MSHIAVDIEAGGPIPGDDSATDCGTVVVEPDLERTFYGGRLPVSDNFIPACHL